MNENTTTETDPSSAFGVLADPTRIEILHALAAEPQSPVSFSALRERVGTADSGRFNYHLGKLVGRFVVKTDGGYRLTTAGHQIYGAILAGTYTDSVAFEPVALDDNCPGCGHHLEARYVDEHLQVVCPDCEHVEVAFAFPPGAFEGRTPAELLETLHRRLRSVIPLARSGTCPQCWGKTESRLKLEEHEDYDEKLLLAVISCTRCSDELRASPGALLLSEPAVIAAYHDQGIDLRDQPLWTIPWLRRSAVEKLSTDPLRAGITIEVGDETLRATIDADATVTEIRREPTDG